MQSSLLQEELRSMSLFNEVADFFVAPGFSIGLGVPRLKDVSGGVYFVYYSAQTNYQKTGPVNRSLDLGGFSYGVYLEKGLKISQRLQLQLGLRFLRNSMTLSIVENRSISEPDIAFENSRSLEVEYKSNAVNPYILMDYKFVATELYDLSVGFAIDYKYMLPSSPWRLTKTDVYNKWVYKNSTTTVDLPFYGNSVIGTGLFFTIRTYLYRVKR